MFDGERNIPSTPKIFNIRFCRQVNHHFGIGLAGFPNTCDLGGNDRITHDPAPITESSPIIIGSVAVPLIMTAPAPMKTRLPTMTDPVKQAPGPTVE